MTILSSIDKKSISEFRNDLMQMLRIGHWIDKYYGEANTDLDIYMQKFISLIELFNKKYKSLNLKLAKKTDHTELKMFLNEKSVKDCFANSASKIIGVQSIGTSNFGAVAVSDADGFAKELEKAKNRLYITYYNPQTGTSNVFLQYDSKEKKVQLVYDIHEIENEPSPEFKLATYYALKESYDKSIDIHDEGATLGFSSLLSHVEKADYFRKFDPQAGE